jgi:Recombination endonuclease VII
MNGWCETCPRKAAAGNAKCRACLKKEWREKNPHKAFEQYEKDRLKRFGVDAYWYEQKLAEQRGVCGICGKPETAKYRGRVVRLSVDHDHKTQKPRGLLCAACNRAIGLMKDNPARLRAAAEYLEQYSKPAQAA